MHLYNDKVMITDKKELMPLMKGSVINVAASEKSGIIYTNVSKEELNDFISRNIGVQSNLIFLKLAIEIALEIKTVPDLQIINDTMVVEETSKADVLMINRGRMIVVVGVEGKIYTNNALDAEKCIQDDISNGEINACLLKALIDMEGLIECELKVE